MRDHNEDSVLSGPDVFAVADGMGGHAGGAVASALAVAGLAALPDLHEAPDPAASLVRALRDINTEIRRRAVLDDKAGMGTTVAGIARISGPRLLVFNVGDSRVYRLRAGQLEQLTEDHSVVGELVRAGRLTEEEARAHPHRNVITRALGVEPHVEPATSVVDVQVGDCFLVASDGLFNELGDTQIGDVLSTPGTVEHRARALLEAALLRGARDNVSVVVVAVAGTAGSDGLEVDTSPSVPDRHRRPDRPPVITAVPRSSLATAPAGDARPDPVDPA